MDNGIRVGSAVIAEAELQWRFSRSSGPGGQGVNTADSRVELVYDLANSAAFAEAVKARAVQRLAGRLIDGTVVVAASEYRSQLRNRQAARERLAALLTEATAPPAAPRRPTRPSRRSQEKRMDEKTRRGQIKRGRQAPPE